MMTCFLGLQRSNLTINLKAESIGSSEYQSCCHPPIRKSDRHGCKLYNIRYAQSVDNICKGTIDLPLGELSIEQASKVEGQFDLVMLSRLHRAMETPHHSQLKYFKLKIEHDVREIVEYHPCYWSMTVSQSPKCSRNINSTRTSKAGVNAESNCNFNTRCTRSTTQLEQHCSNLSKFEEDAKILIIGHAYYLNYWYRRGRYPSPNNATLIKLV